MTSDPASRGPLLVLGAALLWGTTGTAQALGPATSDPLGVGTVRLLLGAAGLVAVATIAGRLRPVGPLSAPAVGLTALGVAAYQPLFFWAVEQAGVALGTVVAIGSGPVFTGAAARVLDGWRPSPRWVSATLLAVGGVALIAGSPSSGSLLGVAAAAGAGASYAVYATGSARLLRSLPPLGAMAWAFGGGALLVVPLLAVVDLGWLASPDGALMAGWLGLGTTTASYVLFGYGLRHTEVATVATLSLGEPLTAMLLGVVLLGERPGTGGWVGAGLVLAGLALLGGAAGRRAPEAA